MENNKKILLIEDDSAAIQLLTIKLSAVGCIVDTITSAQEMEKAGTVEGYTVIISDLNLPGVNQSQIKDFLSNQTTPAILLSASVEDNTWKDLDDKICNRIKKHAPSSINDLLITISLIHSIRNHSVVYCGPSEFQAMFIKPVFNALGMKFTFLPQPEEFSLYLQKEKPLLGVVSLQTKSLSGPEVIRQSSPQSPTTVFLGVSASIDEHVIAEFRRAGAQGVFSKTSTQKEWIAHLAALFLQVS